MSSLGITFDVWETLITDPYIKAEQRADLRLRLMGAVLANSGWSIDAPVLERAYIDSLWVDEDVWRTDRDLSTRGQVRTILDLIDSRLAETLDDDAWGELTKAYVEPIFEYPPDPQDGVLETLQNVKDKGFHLGMICNTGRTPGWGVRRLLESMGIIEYFEVLAFSDEEEVRKPAPQIFYRVVQKLGVPEDRCVHIGDNPVTDIGGAKGIGMNAILIRKTLPDHLPVFPDAHIESLWQLETALHIVFGEKAVLLNGELSEV